MTRSRQTADWGSRAGLAKIVPSSVAVGSGTGSANALGTVTFSGVSSLSLNDVFSSTYANYRINLKAQTSTEADCNMRMRSSGSDDSSGNYFMQLAGGADSTNFAGLNSSITYWYQGGGGRRWHTMAADLLEPNVADNTFMISLSGDRGTNANINANNRVVMQNNWLTTSTQYTGITFYPSSGTMTGTVTIYGYN